MLAYDDLFELGQYPYVTRMAHRINGLHYVAPVLSIIENHLREVYVIIYFLFLYKNSQIIHLLHQIIMINWSIHGNIME